MRGGCELLVEQQQRIKKVVGPLVSLLNESPRVVWATTNPVSAFGFGNSVQLDHGGDDAQPEAGKSRRRWLLRRGAVFEPYGVVPLIAWSFLAGMLLHEVPPEDADGFTNACRLLRRDLALLNAWQIPVKGQF